MLNLAFGQGIERVLPKLRKIRVPVVSLVVKAVHLVFDNPCVSVQVLLNLFESYPIVVNLIGGEIPLMMPW